MSKFEQPIDTRPPVSPADSFERTTMMRAALDARHQAYAIHRRDLLRSEQTLVKRDPKQIASAIALGMVLTRVGLRMEDSWRLDGLLSGPVADLVEWIQTAARHLPDANAGDVLVRAIDLKQAELQALGEYAAWKRRADRYFEDHQSWLSVEAQNAAAWRDMPMSGEQQHLLRASCALLEIALPEGLMRGTAHDWLRDANANLAYRGSVA
jgi:hypothetical protein